MKPRYLIFILCLLITATTIAIPIPDEENASSGDLSQHLGQAGLRVFSGAAMIGILIGGITYGTNWWYRFKTIQDEHKGNMTSWNATQYRKEQQHQKNMQALDIILKLIQNYTDSIGKDGTEIDAFAIADEMEAEVKGARIDREA